ncbi:MAG TPA: DNA mismatch repair protein MutS [Flavobacteriaceae bacterium]|nr:DNA mismatch repair protein MutS [Flavobacteriaceae bacterium]
MAGIAGKTLKDLEFPKVLEQVASFCITDLGEERVKAIKPYVEFDKIEPELKRVWEFKSSFGGDNPIPNHGFESISKELHFLSIENSVLEISGFRRILLISETTRTLLKYFKKYEEFYVYLNDISEKVSYTSIISEEINKRIDRYGEIKDDASAELSEIRKRLNHVKAKINSSFAKALSQYIQLDFLDEIKESVVENKRVLAVKAMYRKRVRGAVMGSSKTGSIVYIEPQETLEYANELSNLLYEEQEEIKRILKLITEFIRPYRSLLQGYQEYLTTMDVISAKAKYGRSIDGVVPNLVKVKRLQLKKAYHPLLLVSNRKRNVPTYPQNISLEEEKRIIVISGPNAGGKSITLKTVGLLQVMLQSGLLLPVDPQSEMCLFKRILTDIGDNQSIENHLSTYSYRLKKMNQFLKKCDSETLFLIDEFGTGSDPELGGALAETFLEVFYEREAFGIITTHYTNLKLLANELPHAINANMLFDSRSLEPLYELQMGEAGSSFTFEVAQKNGIPYSLINRAKKKIESGKVRFDKTIANLQKERSQLRKTSELLKQEEQKARQEGKQLEEVNARVQEKLEDYQELFDANQKMITLGRKVDTLAENFAKNKRKKQLIDEFMKLVLLENSKRKPIAPKEKKIAKQKEKELLKEVEAKVEDIREKKKEEKEIIRKVTIEKPKVPLKVGDRVRMKDGRAIGTIDSIEKNKAIVNYGIFTTNVSVEELEKV